MEVKKMASKKIPYREPAEYFPKETRKKYGLGEYATKKKPAEKKPAPKKK